MKKESTGTQYEPF